jgi:hypothetical protein
MVYHKNIIIAVVVIVVVFLSFRFYRRRRIFSLRSWVRYCHQLKLGVARAPRTVTDRLRFPLFLTSGFYLLTDSYYRSAMGCDGGTIPKRDELVRTKKKPEQVRHAV